MKNARELYDKVSNIVYGHDRAKKILSTAIIKSQAYYYKHHVKGEIVPNHSRVYLLMGHSGCGKTFLVQQLSKLADVPYLYIDATTLNPGASKEGISADKLRDQLRIHARNMITSQPNRYFSISGVLSQTFIFLDEFDKMVKPYGSSDSWQDRVQSEFLAVIDGDPTFAEVNWVFAGAFSEIQEEKFNSPRPIGFNNENTAEKNNNHNNLDLYSKLRKYGFMPELLGRIASVCQLDTLTENDYNRIVRKLLLPVKISELSCYTDQNIEIPEDFIERISSEAVDSGQGVRYCKRCINEYFEDVEFEMDYPAADFNHNVNSGLTQIEYKPDNQDFGMF